MRIESTKLATAEPCTGYWHVWLGMKPSAGKKCGCGRMAYGEPPEPIRFPLHVNTPPHCPTCQCRA